MHLQTLASGSRGNCALVRAGELHLLLDAGLGLRELTQRLDRARVPIQRLDHIALSHGHLDHARSAGALARRCAATLHCCERLMRNDSVTRAPHLSTLPVGRALELQGRGATDRLELLAVKVPHDADPTVAFRLRHGERVASLLTDIGRPDREVARQLRGAHLLVLEFNHDEEMLRQGPYPPELQKRIAGAHGHLSNEEACAMLRWMATQELHTLVLAHLSETNNLPRLALEAATRTLEELGMSHVRVVVAEQDAIGPNLEI